jgi:cytochrome bd-type quinol oxidase subunit 2
MILAVGSHVADPVAARSQMGFSLGWHIVLACFGVGLPSLVVFAEWRGLRTEDPVYRLLARRLLYRRHFLAARLSAAVAVTAVLWAWALSQYPHLLDPGMTIAPGAASGSVLRATLISLGIGAVLLVPSLTWLYVLFQRPNSAPVQASDAKRTPTGSQRVK